MHFSKAFLPFALKAAPICPAPAPADGVEESNSIDDVKCSSTLERRRIRHQVLQSQHANASKPASQAGLTKGTSGDPRRYYNGAKKGSHNGDALHFGVPDCDSKDNDLYEYPFYWQGAKVKESKKNTKSSQQDNTPVRVVYVNNHVSSKYCGIMTDKKVTKDFKGEDLSELCE